MRIILAKIIIIFFFFLSNQLEAQHQTDYWYFGNYAGLNFNSGNPEPITNGALQNYEGCAVISDSLGNLLFYTNGMTVWNNRHQIMENGSGLLGDSSSTQSAIIIPNPGNTDIYYIITADDLLNTKELQYNTDGLRFSIADISLNNGVGAITLKNQILLDSTLEKITAVKHQNNTDYWLIAHEWGNNYFNTWLIDVSGISNSPVISSTGHSYVFNFELDELDAVGYMKINPSGNKLAVAIMPKNKIEIFDFDKSNGIISFLFEIDFDNPVYGCEFSPNGSKLFITSINKLYQVDMNAGTNEEIINSLTEIFEFEELFVGALQLARNGKIYISPDTAEFLSVINEPNELPGNCEFEYNAIYLDGKKSTVGLPNFIQSYFIPPIFRTENRCFSDETLFFIEEISEIDSVLWNFGDPVTGSLNSSKELAPVHVFSSIGMFYVTLTVWFNGIPYNYSENINIVPLPEIFLGNDTAFCNIESYDLNATGYHLSYFWNDLSTDSILTVDVSGMYSVEVENIYTTCRNSDTVNVIFSGPPVIDLGNDTSFCEHTSYLLDAFHESYSYSWQDQSTESFYWVSDPGTYFVSVTNEFGCSNSDTIELNLRFIPIFDFPGDTVLCENTLLNLNFDFEDAEYLWQDGSSDNAFLVSQAGIYKLRTENACGFWTDSMEVSYKYCGDIYIPNVFTPNNDDINNFFKIKGIENQNWNLTIYNRWGQKLMYFENYDNSWTGKDQAGKELTEGVYFYQLINQEYKQSFHGTVRIMR